MATHDDYKKAMEYRLKNTRGFYIPEPGKCSPIDMYDRKPITVFEMLCIAGIVSGVVALLVLVFI